MAEGQRSTMAGGKASGGRISGGRPGSSTSSDLAPFRSSPTIGRSWTSSEVRPLQLKRASSLSRSSLSGRSWSLSEPRPLQLMRRAGAPSAAATAEVVDQALQDPGSTLPHLGQIQRAFGHHDISPIKSHQGEGSRTAGETLGAAAFATGDDIAFSGTPDLHTAAHEAAHVLQQRAGVANVGSIDGPAAPLEKHADAVADKVVRGESATQLLDEVISPQPAAAADRRGASGSVQLLKKDGNAINIATLGYKDVSKHLKNIADHQDNGFTYEDGDEAALRERLEVVRINPEEAESTQGNLGDCWLIATIDAISLTRPELLQARLARAAVEDGEGGRLTRVTLRIVGADGAADQVFDVRDDALLAQDGKLKNANRGQAVDRAHLVGPAIEHAIGQAIAAQRGQGETAYAALPGRVGDNHASIDTAMSMLGAEAPVSVNTNSVANVTAALGTITQNNYPTLLKMRTRAIQGKLTTANFNQAAQGEHVVFASEVKADGLTMKDQASGLRGNFTPDELKSGKVFAVQRVLEVKKDFALARRAKAAQGKDAEVNVAVPGTAHVLQATIPAATIMEASAAAKAADSFTRAPSGPVDKLYWPETLVYSPTAKPVEPEAGPAADAPAQDAPAHDAAPAQEQIVVQQDNV